MFTLWHEMARRPDCILALFSYRGGVWASALNRPDFPVTGSAEPRNFQTRTQTWYDALGLGYAAIGAGDFELEIDYTNHVANPGKIWYDAHVCMLFDGHITFRPFRFQNNSWSGIQIEVWGGAAFAAGRHQVVLKRQDSVAEVWCDGQRSGRIRPEAVYESLWSANEYQVPQSSFNGTIHSVRLTDLTAGETVWQYPRFPDEEKGFMRYLNIRADRHEFEVAAPQFDARIDTQLDLRGKTSAYTAIVDCEVPESLPANKKCELMGQGPAVNGGQAEIMALCVFSYGSSKSIVFSHEVGGSRRALEAGCVGGRHVFAGRAEIVGGDTVLSLFRDGALAAQSTYRNMTGQGVSNVPDYALFDCRQTGYARVIAPIHGAMLFKSALRDEEIKLLSR